LSWASMAISLSWSNMSNCWDPSCSCRSRANSYEKTIPTCVIYELDNINMNHDGSRREHDTVDECHSSHEF
jgi:rRNA-processing protein FCF1